MSDQVEWLRTAADGDVGCVMARIGKVYVKDGIFTARLPIIEVDDTMRRMGQVVAGYSQLVLPIALLGRRVLLPADALVFLPQ